MKLDHSIIKVSDEHQLYEKTIEEIRKNGFSYEPNGAKERKNLRRQTYGLEMNTLNC
jgi:hypothetical protein